MDPNAERIPVVVAEGDGIGPEITRATLRILEAAGARIDWHPVVLGQAAYERGVTTGVPDDAWSLIRRHRVLLKGPITTPQGGGYKSVNVTLRKSLGLYANVRETKSYGPYVPTRHPDMNVVVVRENEEDLYAGIEHRQTREVRQALKLITRPGTERIVRFAFAYARAYGRRKVTCMTKDNIMKLTDGLFHKTFDAVAAEYPDIEAEHLIIDIGTAKLADRPEDFDVIVTLNLYGDILSDVTAQLAGSVGLGGSANIGDGVAMFEAVHGSAPDIAGRGIANPSGMLLAGVQMLVHVGQADVAERVANAWLRTLEEGIHTGDVYRAGTSIERVGTDGFADAVVARLGQDPHHLPPVHYRKADLRVVLSEPPVERKELRGVDVFVDWSEGERDPERIGAELAAAGRSVGWALKMITNRGVRVYPEGMPETHRSDHWRCRFLPAGGEVTDFEAVLRLLGSVHAAGHEVVKTEHLYDFDGLPGYSLGQGE
ncbi:MAG: NADP-dependent isocitrate dehydrogenase [bacterium]|nr:NADP-dependent isocitrate dehydrogenase [bacterium]